MSHDRQQQLDHMITMLRGMIQLDMPHETIHTTAAHLVTQHTLTTSEQAVISQSLGMANLFDHSNVAQGNITGGDFSQKTQSGGNDLHGSQINRLGKVIAGDNIEQQTIIQGVPPRSLDMLMRQYLLNVAASASRIPLPDADSADTSQHEVLLSDIYTRLEVVSSVGRMGAVPDDSAEVRGGEPMHQLSAFEALARHQHMVLLGAPGSGKSTVVNGLVWALAQRGLGTSDDDLLQREGWMATHLTPIMINLSLWNRWLRDHGVFCLTPQNGASVGDNNWVYSVSNQ